MSQSEKAEAFRALHSGEPFIFPNPGTSIPRSALDGLGFKALASTSAGYAERLGREDGEVTLDEIVEHAAELDGATDLPVAMDLENGYGPEPAQAALAITRVGEAGAVGGSIEDWDPGRQGHLLPGARGRARRGLGRGGARVRLPVHLHRPRREPAARPQRPGRHDRAAPGLRAGGRRRPLRAGPSLTRRDPHGLRRGLEAGERPRLAEPVGRGHLRGGRAAHQLRLVALERLEAARLRARDGGRRRDPRHGRPSLLTSRRVERLMQRSEALPRLGLDRPECRRAVEPGRARHHLLRRSRTSAGSRRSSWASR